MDDYGERRVHPFFSPRPALPGLRDIPWMVFVVGVQCGYWFLSKSGVVPERGSGALLAFLALVVTTIGGAYLVSSLTFLLFPPKNR